MDIATAKTRQELRVAVREWLDSAPMMVRLEMSDLTSKPRKGELIVEMLKDMMYEDNNDYFFSFSNDYSSITKHFKWAKEPPARRSKQIKQNNYGIDTYDE